MRGRRHRGGDDAGGRGVEPEATQEADGFDIDGFDGDGDGDDDPTDTTPVPLPPIPRSGVAGALGGIHRFATGVGQPLSEPTASTPLAVDEAEGAVPTAPLWAMKYLRHGGHGAAGGGEGPDVLRVAVGRDDGAVYLIDDGPSHCMVSRQVGVAPDGCRYCLVARVDVVDARMAISGVTEATDLFALGRELTLCGVVEGAVSNVVRVAGYRKLRDVPAEYLPPAPFLEFPEDL